MDAYHYFANPAKPEEQGSFCDTTSGITYENLSREEMERNSAVHAEHSGNTPDVEDKTADRYNATILEVDPLGYESPGRYLPGR